MGELIVTVVAVCPPQGAYRRIIGRDAEGVARGLNIDAEHLLSVFLQPGERWGLMLADDGETVLSGRGPIVEE